jgi:hypothetical protein
MEGEPERGLGRIILLPKRPHLFYVLLTVHLGIIFVNNQRDTQFCSYINKHTKKKCASSWLFTKIMRTYVQRKKAEDCTSETSALMYKEKGWGLHFRNTRTYVQGERLMILLSKRTHIYLPGERLMTALPKRQHLCTRRKAEDCTSETYPRICRGKAEDCTSETSARIYWGKAEDYTCETSARIYRGKAEDYTSKTSARIYQGKGWWLHFRNVRTYLPGKAEDYTSETSARIYRGKAEDCTSETSVPMYKNEKGWGQIIAHLKCR